MEVSHPEPHEVLGCLSGLVRSSDELHRRVSQLSQLMCESADQAPGLPYARTVALNRRLAMMEEISQAVRAVVRDGNRFRRMEARALYAEGLTMAQLATVFGVSRQRVSALLRGGTDGTAIERPAGTLPGGHR